MLGLQPAPETAARAVAVLISAVCGVSAAPDSLDGHTVVLFPCPGGWDPAQVAAAIALERVVPASAVPDGRIAVVVGRGYNTHAQQQIVKAVSKVLHGLCEVHTTAINAVEARSCPLPPRVAAWPWELEGPVLARLAAVAAWSTASRPASPELLLALDGLGAALWPAHS